MTSTLADIRRDVEPFLRARGELLARLAADVTAAPGFEALHARFPALSRRDSFFALRERLAGATGPDADRLKALLRFIAEQVEAAAAAEAEDELRRFEAVSTPWEKEPDLTTTEALAMLPRERSRERRTLLGHSLGRHLDAHSGPYARRLEARERAAEAMGFEGPLALRDAVSGVKDGPLAEAAKAALARTDDAYRDLLGYALKRTDEHLRPLPSGLAQRHDLAHASSTPWLAVHVGRGEVLEGVRRTLTDLALPPEWPRRISVDVEDRPGKTPEPFLAPIRIPEDIRASLRFAGGTRDALDALAAYGRASFYACADPRLEVEERWLGDGALPHAAASLFSGLLQDEGWLRRHLRLPNGPARELARMAAFIELAELRESCAAFEYELLLLGRGVTRELADAYEEFRRKALFVAIPRGFYLRDVSPHLEVADRLRGWALHEALTSHLLERFNEDWWRNPAAGRFLRDTYARGAGAEAMALLGAVLGREPSLEKAALQRVRIMGA